jgi:hypothetical protein
MHQLYIKIIHHLMGVFVTNKARKKRAAACATPTTDGLGVNLEGVKLESGQAVIS